MPKATSEQNIGKLTTKMEDSTSDSSKTASKEKACTASPIRMFIWECGRKISFMGRVYILMEMEIASRASSKKERKTVEEPISTRADQFMKENGIEIEKMGSGSSITQMVKNMKEIG